MVVKDLAPLLLKPSRVHFEGLRDSMNAGFTGQGDPIASQADEEPDDANGDCDSNGSKDDDESLVEGEPPAKKGRLDKTGKTEIP